MRPGDSSILTIMAAPVLKIRRTAKKCRGYLGALAALCLWTAPAFCQDRAASAPAREPSEYDVKAAFLLNFARFVDWPPPRNADHANEPLSICILGDDPFGENLDRLASGESVNDRPIAIRRVLRWDEACRILFVSKSERDLFRILRLVDPGALTVGEDPAFLREGGMIEFVVENRRVRFDLNLKAAERASIRISSRLLTVARRVSR